MKASGGVGTSAPPAHGGPAVTVREAEPGFLYSEDKIRGLDRHERAHRSQKGDPSD
jgi:hypothetical protein